MDMDFLIVAVGVGSFGLFFLIQAIIFRRSRPEQLLRSLVICVLAVALPPVVLIGVLSAAKTSVWTRIIATLLAFLITGLLCLVYVFWVFGPLETSVRMRLVREIGRRPEGISLEELAQQYNPRTILDVRLRRLSGSGDIVQKGDLYEMKSARNFFFFFDVIAGAIKKRIG